MFLSEIRLISKHFGAHSFGVLLLRRHLLIRGSFTDVVGFRCVLALGKGRDASHRARRMDHWQARRRVGLGFLALEGRIAVPKRGLLFWFLLFLFLLLLLLLGCLLQCC